MRLQAVYTVLEEIFTLAELLQCLHSRMLGVGNRHRCRIHAFYSIHHSNNLCISVDVSLVQFLRTRPKTSAWSHRCVTTPHKAPCRLIADCSTATMCLKLWWFHSCDHEPDTHRIKCYEWRLLKAANTPNLPRKCPDTQDKEYEHDFCCSTECCIRRFDAGWRAYLTAAEEAGMIRWGQHGSSNRSVLRRDLVERADRLRDEANKHRECDVKRAAANAELQRARRSQQTDSEDDEE
ncbi:hypothetical protein BDY17DRAFT_33164 [Neohortaea acidophila]|uniref:Uncharacterized protein n=1 Tax=Neohortaea acidophila TaxID=245834 RepID=A0A6A6PJI2_9PEZI|nr:uncharacterized protein BDY17DRAFT_33164 [Neohortaea acidophila]KAF2480159.1 hypothetical protein BDY17DRAFT_33164 [Neohortaea acidophila]